MFVVSVLAVIENMMEFRPEMSAEAAQQGLMQWLLKRIRVSLFMSFRNLTMSVTQQEVVWWCEGVMYLTSPGHPTDIGLQLGKACYPCSR